MRFFTQILVLTVYYNPTKYFREELERAGKNHFWLLLPLEAASRIMRHNYVQTKKHHTQRMWKKKKNPEAPLSLEAFTMKVFKTKLTSTKM